MSYWTTKNVEDCRAKIYLALDEKFASSDYKSRIFHLLDDLDALEQRLEPLERFIHCLLILELHSKSKFLSEGDYRHILKVAEMTLKTEGIEPKNSRLSYLYGELHLIQCQLALGAGEINHAAWQAELSYAVTTKAPASSQNWSLLFQGDALLRMGHARLAGVRFNAVAQSEDHHFQALAKNKLIESEHWSGNLHEALDLAKELDEERKTWIEAVIKLQQTSNFDHFLNQVRRKIKDPVLTLTAKLWIYSSKHRSLYDKLPKVDTLRKKMGSSTIQNFDHKPVVSLLRTIEDSYDQAIPLEIRLQKIGELLEKRNELPSIEYELLALGTALRVLIRHSQKMMAQLVCAEYGSLSSKLSLGTSRDILKIFSDINLFDLEIGQNQAEKQKSGSRTGKIIATAAKGVGIVASSQARRIMASTSEKQRIKEEEFSRLGELMANSFGELKGGLMKVGQILSLIADISPQFANPLRRMHLDAAPTPASDIEQVIFEQFGKKPTELFKRWSSEALAIGSIGQVHRAQLQSGEEVVVKIQHPGIEESLRSDLKILGILRPAIKKMFPPSNTKEILKEIRGQILSELDYAREIENQKYFLSLFSNEQNLVIPKIYDEYCSDKVITSEYISGQSFEDFCENATQDEKNTAAMNIVKTYLMSIWPNGKYNCDPHTNNYIFLENGKIALLDYGCVKNWSHEFVDAWQRILLSSLNEDAEGCFQGFVDTGAYDQNANFDKKILLNLTKIMCEPIMNDSNYTFSHDFVRRNSEALYFANSELKQYFSPPANSTMMMRFSWGLYSVLADLNATQNWNQIVLDHFRSITTQEKSKVS